MKSLRSVKIHMKTCKERLKNEAEVKEENNVPAILTPMADEIRNEDMKASDVKMQVDEIYNHVVHWRKNLFDLPKGKSGKLFVAEIANIINNWCNKTTLRDISFKLIAVMPALLLQKTSRKQRSKENKEHLERRIQAWREGDYNSL